MQKTLGIHHITAIVGNPQENINFYGEILGLRFVKKTVNFDDPSTYHFYFGDEIGSPGSIMTFFPWSNERQGRIGSGQVGITTFVVPEGALSFWEDRLENKEVPYSSVTRFQESFLQFQDPHGLQLEIVARGDGNQSHWEINGIDTDHAIKGIGGAVLYTGSPYQTEELLTNVMGLKRISQQGDYLRLESEGEIGNIIDIKLTASPRGEMGVGTVHHIAWRCNNRENQVNWRQHISTNGFFPTDMKDRQYFESIYFQEKGGILFEIATDEPGFTTDESKENLGTTLKLPSWYEVHRDKIEQNLEPVQIPTDKGGK
ncbi:ring-cleaving dioxygenase [Salirhabdus salicampi]|uniref:ring-cleaving dioxygenase n=1 Tax=Salirhabdus salicampi TaxID=476102 RepID=UPI0020C54BF0|nr:ring-cleaving dioxygenase [Salirhabdus salicampi]MCP8616180.1 ring-cleaving dioxygenase [Salirhabdus salicampi]